ncbi:MAG: hypothetical protein AMJ90_04530 [candidate division Zixibacteria bacterium SM23_73_2]|nr:MAG: hypothetical protein AMJ90_04530 [candidate division Zixibacteria bacterium SM23_73_2]
MKILTINWQDISNPQAGGAEIHLEEIMKRIAKRGNHVTLFCSSYPGAKRIERRDGLKIIRKGSRYNFNLVAFSVFPSLLRQEKPDLVIEDINKIPFYLPLLHNLPTLIIIPHLFADSVFQEINYIMGLYIFLSEKPIRRIYRNKDFLVISESTKIDLVKRNIPAENVQVIKCGIEHSLYKPNQEVPRDKNPLALYVGRIKKYKSIDLLIDAFSLVSKKIPEAYLAIVGDGDYASQLKQRVRGLKLDKKVVFTGYVSLEEKLRWLRRAWVSVYPSLKEGWGLTNIEANACGTPVLASDVPGLKDSVKAGESGFLFPYGDSKKLSELMLDLFTKRKLREKLSEGGLRWAKNFSWDKAALETMILIENIIGKRWS